MKHTVMIMRRMLTGILAAAMIMTGLPSYVFAGTETPEAVENVQPVAAETLYAAEEPEAAEYVAEEPGEAQPGEAEPAAEDPEVPEYAADVPEAAEYTAEEAEAEEELLAAEEPEDAQEAEEPDDELLGEKQCSITFRYYFSERYSVSVDGKELTYNIVKVTEGNDFSFRVEPEEEYQVLRVYKGSVSEENRLTPDAEGVYTLEAVDGDTDIYVVSPQVLYVSKGGYNWDYSLAPLDVDDFQLDYTGVDYNQDNPPYPITKSEDITVTISGKEGKIDIDSCDIYLVNESSPTLMKGTTATIPKNRVIQAENSNSSLSLTFLLKLKTYNLWPAKAQAADFYLYQEKDGNGQLSKLIEGNTGNPVVYGKDATIVVIPDPDTEVKKVKADGQELAALEEKVTAKIAGSINAAQEYTAYRVPGDLVKKNLVLSVETAAQASEEDVTFTVDAKNCTFATSARGVKYNKETGVVTVPKNTASFAYTIETKGNYILTAGKMKLLGIGGQEEPTRIRLPEPVVNKKKDGLLYNMTGNATLLAGKTISAEAVEKPRKLFIMTGFDVNSVEIGKTEVRCAGTVLPGPRDTYDIEDPFATLTILGAARDGYKLTGKATVNGKEVDASKGIVTTTAALCDESGYVRVGFGTAEAVRFQFGFGSAQFGDYYPEGVVCEHFNKDAYVQFREGYNFRRIHDCTVTPQNAVMDGFVSYESGYLILHRDKIRDYNKTLQITASAINGGGSVITGKFSISFVPPVTSATVSGVKNGELSQPMGTSATYDVKLNKGASPGVLAIRAFDEDLHAKVKFDPATMKLSVETFYDIYDTIYLQQEAFDVVLYEKDYNKDVLSFKVVPTAVTLNAPNISVKNVSDVDMMLSLSLPRGLSAKNLFYEVSAVPSQNETVTAPMVEEVKPFYVRADSAAADAVRLPLAKKANPAYNAEAPEENNPEFIDALPGEGHEQKYDITVRLVQAGLKYSGNEPETETIIQTGQEKTLKNQKTKNVAYEVKMSVTKKTTAFFKGEKNVLVGVAKFSAGTSFTQIDEANSYVQDAEGNKLDGVSVKAGADGISLYLPQTSGIPVGKATVVVKPNLPTNTVCTPATIPLTVKQPIEGMYLTPYDNAGTLYLFKPAGKAGTLKFTVHFIGDTKPASAKVKWSLSTEGYSKVKEYVSVKNGTVTVDKALIMGDWSEASRRVTIAAMADDFEGNTVIATRTFVVTGENLKKDGSMVLYDKTSNPVEDTDAVHPDAIATLSSVENVTSGYVVICDSTNTRMQPENFTYKVAPKGLTIDKDTGRFTSTPKSGTYTVTATGKDPAKTEYKLTFTVAETTPAYECRVETPTREILTPKENNTDENGNPVITYRSEEPFSHFTFLMHRSDRSILDNTRVKVTGGKTLTEQKDAYGTRVFVIQPTTDPVVIQYEKTTVKVYNRLPEQTITIEPLPDLYANAKNAVYAFKVKTDTGEGMHIPQNYGTTVKFDHILFTEGEQLYKYKKDADKLNYRMMMVWLNNNRVDTDPSAEVYDGSFTSTISSSPFPDVPAGTYTYTATLVTTDHQSMSFGTGGMVGFGKSKVTYHSAPTTFSIKVKKGKAATAKIDPKVKMTLEADKWSGEISFKKSDFASISAVTLYNCNEKGVVVPLTSFFVAEISEDEKKIVLLQKKDDEFDPAAYPGTISGYIEYELVKGDGETNPDMTKVKRTEKFTMTFQ